MVPSSGIYEAIETVQGRWNLHGTAIQRSGGNEFFCRALRIMPVLLNGRPRKRRLGAPPYRSDGFCEHYKNPGGIVAVG